MIKLKLVSPLLLLPLHLIASNQIFEAGTMVRLADTSAGLNEAYWLFDSSNHYFGHYPSQAAEAFGNSSYFEEGSYALNSLGNNQVGAQLNSAAYATLGYNGGTGSASRTATVTLTSPFSANYSGTRTEISGVTESFNGNLTIYPAQDYAPEVLPIGSVWDSDNAYYYSAAYSGPDGGNRITVLSGNSLQSYNAEYNETNTGSYTYTKLGSNLGRISISDPVSYYTASINLFFRSPSEVYFYGNTTDYYGSYTDWGAMSVTYPSSYAPPAIFPAPSTLPQNQILQITGTNSDLSLNLAEGSWADASGGNGSFTYTYAVQSGGVAGLTLNRIGQTAPASSEHFALRFTDDGVGEVVYSSLDGSQSFNLIDAPVWELYDDFSGSVLDTQKWETWYWPGGQVPAITNGQLKLENGGGSGRKEAAFMSTLQSAGFDLSSGTYHSGVAFTDPSIIGVEADLYLPSGVAAESGVSIDLFEQVSSQEIRNTGVELGYWGGNQAELWFAKSAYTSGTKTSVVDNTQYVTLGDSYRIRVLRQDGSIKLYADDVLVQTHDAEGELLAFIIVAFNDVGQPMTATVDNVRVLRDTTIEPPLPVIESYGNTDLLEDGSGYYAGSADTPLVYGGTQISDRTYAGFTALGVDLVNGAYRVILSNGSQYYAANFSLSGSNSNTWAVVSNILVEEVNLQQDFDDDGYVGTPPVQPPASLAGKAYQYSIGGNDVVSVPWQVEFDSATTNRGFAGSLIYPNQSYTYGNGVVSYDGGDEIRLTYTSATAGSYEYWELDYGQFYLEEVGTFNEVAPSLVLKNDWQRTETLDSPLSDQYWNIWRRSVDSLAYDEGELSFIFSNSTQDSDGDTGLQYGRTLPMNENWQVVLEDIYVAPGLSGFEIELELEIAGSEFECELYFADYGNGREFGVELDRRQPSGDWEFAQAYITANEDTRISSGGNVRIVHIASSRELIFEYLPDGASEWSELARLNLESGSFQGENLYGSLTGGILSTTDHSMTVGIEAEASLATQLGDLEIAGIEISSYTPPPATWELYDDFSGSVLDTQKWDFAYWDGGNIPTLSSGRALLSGNTVSDLIATEVTDAMLQANASAASLVGGDGQAHSILEFQDSDSISGIEMQLTLPADISDHIGIGLYAIDYDVMFNDPNQDPIRFDLDLWNSSGASPAVEITWKDPVSGLEQEANSVPVTAGQTVLLKFERTGETIRFFVDNIQVAESGYISGNETFMIRAVSEFGYSFLAYVDNVRVLRDTTIEPPLPVIESYGNTDLLEDGSGYYAGSADTPLVYGGTQISDRTYAGFTALGVDLVNGAYRVILSNGSQYYAANFSLSGSNSNTWAVVSNILVEEVNLQQDFDDDGYVGTPPVQPPASLAGKQIEYQPSGGETSSVPWQELYGSDGNAQFGFSGSVIERIPYTYSQGVVTYTIFSEEIRLSFETATSGTYEYVELDGADLFVNEVGNFSIVAPTLEVKTDDWQRSETMDSPLSTNYWNTWRRTVDSVAYNAGELSFIFANGGEPGEGDYPEIEIEYGRTLPLDENWQVVLDDLYASSVSDFRIGFDLSFLDPDSEVDCSFSYGDYGFGGRQVNADVERRGDTYVYSAGAFVRANQDASLQGGVNLRVRHNAASRDLLFEYQPDGASGWTELARLNLGDGTFAGTNQYGDGVAPISGEVISASERFAMDVEVEAGQATQLGDLEIAGIEIGSYTPPPTPVDSDGDGLDDRVETNTGVYVSPSDTGTDPNKADSSGDGFTDGEVVSAGLSPVVDYTSLLAIVRSNPDRFGLEDTDSTVDMKLRGLRLERAGNGAFNMNFDLEMSTDLQTWTPHTSHSIEIPVPDQSKTFMRLNVK